MEEKNINDILGIKNSQSESINEKDTTRLGIKSSQSESINEKNTTRYRYPALRTISGVFMVLAWIIGIAAIITTVYFLSVDRMEAFGLVSLIVGGLLALGFTAISESIKVIIDIEYNTRKASEK